MSESWLETRDPELDGPEIERRIEARMARRGATDADAVCEELQDLQIRPGADTSAAGVSTQETPEERVSRWLHECDIVPENYVIDWRVPMIGPIHAAIRRVIYAEIRRSVLPALTKQSHLNRAVLQTLSELCQENARLRQELEALRQNQEPER